MGRPEGITLAALSRTQLIELARLVTNVEHLYGMPMDIEWAYEHNRLYLLQARPITTYVPLTSDMVTKPGARNACIST